MRNARPNDAQVSVALAYQNAEGGYGFWDKDNKRRECLQAIENRMITTSPKSENW